MRMRRADRAYYWADEQGHTRGSLGHYACQAAYEVVDGRIGRARARGLDGAYLARELVAVIAIAQQKLDEMGVL